VCADVTALPDSWEPPPEHARAHVATINFALNYMCGTPLRLQAVLRAAAASVRPGGFLIVTFTNRDAIARRVVATGSGGSGGSGLRVHESPLVRIEAARGTAKDWSQGTGAPAYTFTLRPAVNGCVEYGLGNCFLEALACATGWVCNEFVADITQAPRDWDACIKRPRPALSAAARDVCSLYATALFVRV
jgi:hypothetical protein